MLETELRLEQVFYGHNGTGYGILASSDPSLNAVVESFCQQIGTPSDRDPGPILLSIPHGNRLFMILGQTGRLDNMQRRTLLFHAFAADLQKANECRLTAFVLWEGQYFRRTPDSQTFWLNVPTGGFTRDYCLPEFQWDGRPCAVISDSFSIPQVRAVLGERVNSVGWSSFSFQKLSDHFRIYVLSPQAVPPKDRLCVKSDGNPFPIHREPENVPVSTSSKSETSEKNAPSWLRKAFAVSLLLNLLFAGGSWLGQESKPSTVSVPPDMEKLKEEMRTQVLDELRKAFPEECVIKNEDWEKLKVDNHSFFDKKDPEIKYLDKYIEVVNDRILRKDEK